MAGGGGGEKEGEATSSVRAVLPEIVEELWEAVLWIPAGVFGVLISISCFIFPISWFLIAARVPYSARKERGSGTGLLGRKD